VVAQAVPKPGQLASLRRRKTLAATEGALDDPLSPEVSGAAADVNSRSTEGRLEPYAERRDDGLIVVAAPLLEGGECVGAAVVEYPAGEAPASRWGLTLLLISLFSVGAALATRDGRSLRRGALGALVVLAFGGALALL